MLSSGRVYTITYYILLVMYLCLVFVIVVLRVPDRSLTHLSIWRHNTVVLLRHLVSRMYDCISIVSGHVLSWSSVFIRVSTRLSSSDVGGVSTRSAMSWDKSPYVEHEIDRFHCNDILYVCNVNIAVFFILVPYY